MAVQVPESPTGLTKKDAERILGIEISDWQWAWIVREKRQPEIDWLQGGKFRGQRPKWHIYDEAQRMPTDDGLLHERDPRSLGHSMVRANLSDHPLPEDGIIVDGLHVPEHMLHARRGGLRWGDPGRSRTEELGDFIRWNSEVVIPGWCYNEYTMQSERGRWYLYGLPGGPRPLLGPSQYSDCWGEGFHRYCRIGRCFVQAGGVERTQARTSTDD